MKAGGRKPRAAGPAAKKTKVKNKDFEKVKSAVLDVGANRLPYRLAESASDKVSVLEKAIARRETVKDRLSQPYLPEGVLVAQIKNDGEARRLMGFDGYTAALKEIEAMMEAEVELELGAPIDLSELDDAAFKRLVLMGPSLGTLKQYGLIVEP